MAEAEAGPNAGPQVGLIRLYALRLLFLLMAVFLLTGVAPALALPAPTLMTGVARALFTALGLLALLGVRYPLQMLPLMMFEGIWKAAWLAAYGLPSWVAGTLDPDQAQTFKETGVGVILVVLVIPWGYLWARYVRQPGDRWR